MDSPIAWAVAVVVVVLAIVSVVMWLQARHAHAELHTLKQKAGSAMVSLQAARDSLVRQHDAAAAADAARARQALVQSGRSFGPVRATVSGALPGSSLGATASRTSGPAFPPADAPASAVVPWKRDSVWADDLPAAGSGSPSANSAIPGARQSAAGLGGGFALTSSKELFSRTPDELDKDDMDVRDMFPVGADAAPKNGHEAIAASYTWENFRAAHARDSKTGYLAPLSDRQGWSKLGARDMPLWREQMAALAAGMPTEKTLEEYMDTQMVAVPDQFLDFMTEAAEARGIRGLQRYGEGMGGEAAGELYASLERESAQRSGRWAGPTAATGGNGRGRGSKVDAAAVMRDATQHIPRDNAAEAKRVIAEIAEARRQAWDDKFALPELSSQQLGALGAWAAKPSPVREAALALARQTRTPLPPAF